jgi:hypothetical protein
MDEKILQFPEVFLVLKAVLDIDIVNVSFIMESIIESICLTRCKGVSAEAFFNKEDPVHSLNCKLSYVLWVFIIYLYLQKRLRGV